MPGPESESAWDADSDGNRDSTPRGQEAPGSLVGTTSLVTTVDQVIEPAPRALPWPRRTWGPLLLLLLLLPLLWGGSLQQPPGYGLQVQESVTVQECLGANVSCSFSFPGSERSAPYIYWFRQGDNVHTSAPVATNDPQRPVKAETEGRFHLLGNRRDDCSLSIRDARMSDSGTYFFRVVAGYRERYTYRNTLNLQVTALTEKPDIQFLEPLESGRPTSLTCSLPVVCAGARFLRFSWAGDALDAVDPETLHSSVLTLTPRPQDHGTNLTCQVKLQGGQGTTLERTVQLNVSYAPQLMTIRLFQGNSTAGLPSPTEPGCGLDITTHRPFSPAAPMGQECEGETVLPAPPAWLCLSHPDLKSLSNGTSLLVLEGQFLRLFCVADSNPPAVLSWFQDGKALSPSQPSAPGVLELPHVGAADGGEVTCQAQNVLASQHVSISLSVWKNAPSCSCVSEKQQGSWPLVLTLIRGALMGAGFLLTYGLTWIYYTRCGGH
ncbi:Sialic acid-binding Ig-like lectin 14 [Camelus dromedarius]|uniref:Sialic acid-binding Ig-like lectin 14 n=1 Tax=Camelus dromedarius TaxID=9838 RepID=A0A5N4DRM0_CAMDR|nr:Sialic acid-binding Ig-like lectin 14 [Camelus dromedarius]